MSNSVSVPIMIDDTVEVDETFNLTLSFSTPLVSKGITIDGIYSATVIITDSTGKRMTSYYCYYCIVLY